MLVRRVQMTALLLSLKGSQPKTTCKWRLLQIIISQLVGTYRSSLSSQSSSFALVSVSISMVSSVSVLVHLYHLPLHQTPHIQHSHYSHTHYHHYTSVHRHVLHQRLIHFLWRDVQDSLLKKNITTLHWLAVIFYDGKPVGLSFVSSLCVYALNDKKFIIQENSLTD